VDDESGCVCAEAEIEALDLVDPRRDSPAKALEAAGGEGCPEPPGHLEWRKTGMGARPNASTKIFQHR
jgi:hypothetical protein